MRVATVRAPESVREYAQARDKACGVVTRESRSDTDAAVWCQPKLTSDPEREYRTVRSFATCREAWVEREELLTALLKDQNGLCVSMLRAVRASRAEGTWEEWEAATREGLVEAAIRYQPKRGAWSSFASKYIKSRLMFAVRHDEGLPLNNSSEMRIRAIYRRAKNEDPDISDEVLLERIRETVGYQVSTEVYERVVRSTRSRRFCTCTALPCECGGWNADSASKISRRIASHYFAVDGLTPPPEEEALSRVWDTQLRDVVADALKMLKPQQRQVVVALFGLDGREPKSLNQVADLLGVSRQRVSKVKQDAFNVLSQEGSGLRHMFIDEELI